MSARTHILLTCALSFACAPSGDNAGAEAQPPTPAPGGPTAPTFTKAPDVKAPEVNAPDVKSAETGPEGEEIFTVEGELDIDRVAGGKEFQGVWFETDSARYVLSYRPADRFLPFQEKRVTVTGYVEHIPPNVQSIGATHFVVRDIALAPGETPHDPVPTAPLTPRMVRTAAEVMASANRWVQIVGTLTGSTPDASSDWVEVTVDVDGVAVTFTLSEHYYQKGWAAHEGEAITVPGRFGDDPASSFHHVPRDEACPGEDPDCWTR